MLLFICSAMLNFGIADLVNGRLAIHRMNKWYVRSLALPNSKTHEKNEITKIWFCKATTWKTKFVNQPWQFISKFNLGLFIIL